MTRYEDTLTELGPKSTPLTRMWQGTCFCFKVESGYPVKPYPGMICRLPFIALRIMKMHVLQDLLKKNFLSCPDKCFIVC